MAFAENYHRWIAELFRPFLRGTVLELGAGIGDFSSHLLREEINHLILVEPAAELINRLRYRFARAPAVKIHHGELLSWATSSVPGSVDAVIAVNVLEHIEDDRAVLRLMSSIVRPRGAVLLLVPALPWLYGTLDVAFGHWRRYSKAGLVDLLTREGLSIRTLRYVNMAGVPAWFIAGRALRRRSLSPLAVKVMDSTVIRVAKQLETRIEAPFGQSLLVAAERPA
jgi:SAM-dependent methyltransferase